VVGWLGASCPVPSSTDVKISNPPSSPELDRGHRLSLDQLAPQPPLPIMASKLCRPRALASALRPARPSIAARSDSAVGLRCLATTPPRAVALPKDAPNPRSQARDAIGVLKVPLVNPADKYQSKADDLHKYGSWLMATLPKYIQQFSVWKDELTIYICPSGVIPVHTFLKCACNSS